MEQFKNLMYLDINTDEYEILCNDIENLTYYYNKYVYERNDEYNKTELLKKVIDGIRKCKIEDKVDKNIFEIKSFDDIFNIAIKKPIKSFTH